MKVTFKKINSYAEIEESDCDGVIVVYDDMYTYTSIYLSLPRSIKFTAILLEHSVPHKNDATPNELYNWHINYMESYLNIKDRIDNFLQELPKSSDDIILSILDKCDRPSNGAGWRQTILTYALSNDHVDYMKVCHSLMANHGLDFMKQITPTYKAWVLPILGEHYDFVTLP